MKLKDDSYFMQLALKEAEAAAAEGEIPVGCIIIAPRLDGDSPSSLKGLSPFLQGDVGEGFISSRQALSNPQTSIIAKSHNQVETLHDPTAHAEMIALTQAADLLATPRLIGTTVYVTLEPCPMCVGAMVLARIGRLVYGAADPKTGAIESVTRLLEIPKLNHRFPVAGGVLAEESSALLKAFFSRRRKEAKRN